MSNAISPEALLRERKNTYDAYLRAEQCIKEAENYFRDECPEDKQGPIVPALNELRYAGNHLARSLVSESDEDALKEYQKVLNHCKRAIYDVLETRILFVLDALKDFRDEFQYIALSDVITNYQNDRVELRRIKKLYVARNGKNPKEDWLRLENDFATVRDIYERWQESREDLNKKVDALCWERAYKLSTRKITIYGLAITAGLAAFGIIISIALHFCR